MAAAFGPFEEIDELVQCVICHEEYDTGERLPKFLDCTHSFCLTCIKAWVKNKVIDCPVCRDVTQLVNGVADLKTNRYSVKELEKRRDKNIDDYIGGFLWCLRCGRAAQMDCSISGHSLLTVSSKQMFQDLIQLNEAVVQCKVNWSQIINIRRTFQQSKLDCVAKCMKVLQDHVNCLSEENQLQIARAESLLNINESFGLHNWGKPDIAERKALYALSAKESQAVLKETCETLKQFDTVEQVFCRLVACANGSTVAKLKLQFEETDAYTTMAAFAMAAILKDRIPNPQLNGESPAISEAAADDYDQLASSEKADEFLKVPGGKNKKKEASDYATALKHPPTSVNGAVSRPLSTSQTRCFFDMNVDGKMFGRVVILLATDVAPEMCKIFTKACRGQGISYKNTRIFQTKENRFICGGSMEETQLPKLYTPDRSTLKDERGWIRMRRRDDVKEKVILVSTEFHIILTKEFSHRYTTVFGRIVEGLDVCDNISYINPISNSITIRDCGVL